MASRWRGYLRAFHRDFGYLAIGFTVIYAVSGIAQNHIEDWGDVSYKTYEEIIPLDPIPEATPDAQAIALVVDRVGLGKPTTSLRAGDEIRLEYASGAKASAIGDRITVQGRSKRIFIGAANWLHRARNKHAWKYVADLYAILLLYLAISGIFMIKGRLGLKWRGAILISIGVAVPMAAVLFGSEGAPTEEVASAPPAPQPAVIAPPPSTETGNEPEPEHLPPPVIPDKFKGTQ
jgi:hypothetical protein